MAGENGSPVKLDENLVKLARSFGLSPTELAGAMGGGGGRSANEPTVYFGTKKVESSGPRYQQTDPRWKPDGKRKVLTQSDPRWKPTSFRNPVDEDDVKSLSEANAAFYAMEENELADLQRRLIRAGILDPKKTVLGNYDDDTYSAFAAINERTAKFNAVGKKFTPSDVLGMIERKALPFAGEQQRGNVNTLTNPVDLEQAVQSAAKERLGRKLRQNEVKKFVALYQGMERGTNARMNAAADRAEEGGDTTMVNPASGPAAVDQYIDANFAQEEAGQSAYDYLGALRNLIGS